MKGQEGGEATDPAGWEKTSTPGDWGGVDHAISCGSMATTQKLGTFPTAIPLGCTLIIQLAS